MNKYRNTPCTDSHGRKFPSKLERDRSNQLILAERSGAISNLQRQVRFPLMVGAVKIGTYVADFVYLDATGQRVIEDAKGELTPLCKRSLKHMEAQGDAVTLWPARKVKRKAKANATKKENRNEI